MVVRLLLTLACTLLCHGLYAYDTRQRRSVDAKNFGSGRGVVPNHASYGRNNQKLRSLGFGSDSNEIAPGSSSYNSARQGSATMASEAMFVIEI